ncbi:outer membrane protein assembly factor BamB family protein [Paenibacillus apiarius]|uniref:PQQ-binding-like beta-propeller repeat protein n=1 Tax=Paenibacillus apiarius TaxID=46240 RepID=A0ABT4DNN1_9BACL|nr:PQQ-binding-like beta-propeller repeat protein [Paenibacillus apiarius]MCY9512979.1 PQQ-binding-like beta-propeller repeat protein [Paenibacillus apiarius]MCY9518963.1 PQQ-binding-like beta-propeller repeat protein [Paenibacillus apiarius]MCY9550772.1 PQQ-binding-like beta-propeller repeat protein [Paenibacillus apiarius]MCY9559794.1 PQQ-binding-like beta-propeller repeat protein [Paenibacillus apiarius]MCY9682037.1 PQQ-binding-like beta-propeller repeat protein [Paenibacillus apiarius]
MLRFNKKVHTILAAILLLAFCMPASAQPSSAHPNNNQWSRHSDYSSPVTKPKIAWAVPIDDSITNMVIDSKGTIYTVSSTSSHSKSRLTAVSPQGKIQWKAELDSKGKDLVLFRDNMLIVSGYGNSAEEGVFSTLSAYSADGQLQWESTFPGMDNTGQGSIGVDDDGMFVMSGLQAGEDGNQDIVIVAVNTLGGTLWSKTHQLKSPHTAASSPIVIKDGIYLTVSKDASESSGKGASAIQYNDGRLLRLDKEGNVVWSRFYHGYHHASPVYAENTLYVPAGKHLYLYDRNGKRKQKIEIEGAISNWIAPSIGKNGNFYYGQRMIAPSGNTLWSFSPLDIPFSNEQPVNTVAIDSKYNVLYGYNSVKGKGGGLISANSATKKVNWKLPLYQSLSSPPVIGKDGTIYIGGSKLFAIKAAAK